MSSPGLLSKLIVGAVGLTSKAFLNIGYCRSVTIDGAEHLYAALQSKERDEGRGIVTGHGIVANHISTLDDPLTWGIIPARFFFNHRTTRWTLGASDIMFTNSIFSLFFRQGQVLETFRGSGVFQPAIDTAIKKVNQGEWIHLFGEGKVNQPPTLTSHRLIRFKWGVGRIIMEAQKPPVIIPMWLEGFDKLMPEGRSAPWKFLPRPGIDLRVTFGKPVSNDEIREALHSDITQKRTKNTTRVGFADAQSLREEARSAEVVARGWLGGAADPEEAPLGDEGEQMRRLASVRSAVTAILQKDVQRLGDKIMARRKEMGV